MRRPTSTAIVSAIALSIVWSCGDGEGENPMEPEPAPRVSSLDPPSGPVGATITINGENFSETAGQNDVSFNGVSADVSSSTGSQILTTVPTGAASGLVTVTVGGQSAIGPVFQVDPDPAGVLAVAVATTGDERDLDTDGYRLSVDGMDRGTLPINGATGENVLYLALLEGTYDAELTGLRSNCDPAGDNPRSVEIEADDTTRVDFDVTCLRQLRDQIVFVSDRGYDFGETDIWVMGDTGSDLERLTSDLDIEELPRVSPDGTHIAYLRRDASDFWQIVIIDARGEKGEVITSGAYNNRAASWSPDGTELVFVSNRDGDNEIYRMPVAGGTTVPLTDDPANDYAPAWSPDGATIAFASDRDGDSDIYVMATDGSGLTNLTNTAADEFSAAWSPDVSRIAFATNRDGNREIYVMDADGSDPIRVTDHPGVDSDPAWSWDGTDVIFHSNRDGDNDIYGKNADGSGLVTNLTDSSATDRFASPSHVR